LYFPCDFIFILPYFLVTFITSLLWIHHSRATAAKRIEPVLGERARMYASPSTRRKGMKHVCFTDKKDFAMDSSFAATTAKRIELVLGERARV
jgi:hypothetical protein